MSRLLAGPLLVLSLLSLASKRSSAERPPDFFEPFRVPTRLQSDATLEVRRKDARRTDPPLLTLRTVVLAPGAGSRRHVVLLRFPEGRAVAESGAVRADGASGAPAERWRVATADGAIELSPAPGPATDADASGPCGGARIRLAAPERSFEFSAEDRTRRTVVAQIEEAAAEAMTPEALERLRSIRELLGRVAGLPEGTRQALTALDWIGTPGPLPLVQDLVAVPDPAASGDLGELRRLTYLPAELAATAP